MSTIRRAAVLGSPIAHSLSPVLHRAAYAELGLDDWSYDRFEIDEAGLPGFVGGLDDSWAGLSLTMPLKRAIIPLLDGISDTAASVEAVNTSSAALPCSRYDRSAPPPWPGSEESRGGHEPRAYGA